MVSAPVHGTSATQSKPNVRFFALGPGYLMIAIKRDREYAQYMQVTVWNLFVEVRDSTTQT